jgi:hypothetical protein
MHPIHYDWEQNVLASRKTNSLKHSPVSEGLRHRTQVVVAESDLSVLLVSFEKYTRRVVTHLYAV